MRKVWFDIRQCIMATNLGASGISVTSVSDQKSAFGHRPLQLPLRQVQYKTNT
jgi:hypothetical protein